MSEAIFIEAETFDHLGGWTIDTTAYEALGSIYLLAHGTGRPVSDAYTAITIPADGLWHVHVRTRDWTAVWKRGKPAGRFQLLIDGTPLASELGTNGSSWNWQKAGTLKLVTGIHTMSLHDLTGFDGRCDAIFLTRDPQEIPPDERQELSQFRRNSCKNTITDDPEVVDLLICGGGFAGFCMALAAQRKGLKIKLIQDRPMLGGCGSSEVRVWTGGKVMLPPYPQLGAIAQTLSPVKGRPGDKKAPELFEDDRKQLLFTPQQELLLNEILVAVETAPDDPHRIVAVVTRAIRTGRETRRRAELFADCTGDATLARLVGCEVMYGTEGRDVFNETLAPEHSTQQVMGHSTLWETRKLDHPVSFPDIDWGIEFSDATALPRFNCCWDWETGQYRNQVSEIEYIRDYGLMTCFANWSFLKNHSQRRKEWANMDLEWISAIGGKRESYRVYGDLVLTQQDIEQKTPYDDPTGAITWSIDLHYPDPENQATFGEAFQSCAYHRGIASPYPVPYRCLYARDMKNLFLGGRCISLSHVAFSSVRVMRTLGMLGEAAGIAAALCIKHDCFPREIYHKYRSELSDSLREGISMESPCSYMPGSGESYHFMRPTGMYGNSTEDCWIHYNENGETDQPVPDQLALCIKALNQ